jgi:hypothetical protein
LKSRRPRPRRRGRRSFAATALAGALAAGAVALPAAGGGSAAHDAAPLDAAIAQRYERVTVAGGELERAGVPVPAGPLGAARGKDRDGGRLRLSYYVGVDFQEVPPGGAQLFEIRCPTKGEQPLAGGTFAPVPGVVTVSSSRVNPDPEFPTRPRAWYQAVVNIMGTTLRWKPFVTCGTAKGIIR